MSVQTFLQKLKLELQNSDSSISRKFEMGIQGLVILSMVSLALETLPNLSPEFQHFLKALDTAIILLFTLEYLIRCYLAPKKWKFIFSFYGLVDLFAILPFYLSLGIIDSRAFRLFRLIRLIRLLKLVRYNQAIQRLHKAIVLAKEELILFTGANLIFVFFAALGIYHFEHEVQPDKFQSLFDSLWWAVITLTTVGYGDIYPITVGGRVFTFFLLIVGLGIIAVPPGLIAAAMTQASLEEKG